jgi:hypothetical protein
MNWLFLSSAALWITTHGNLAITWLALIAVAGSYVLLRPSKGFRFAVIAATTIIVTTRLVLALYQSLAQYWIWKSASFTALFLPPHQSISYYLLYVGSRFWLPVALAVVLSVIWYLFLRALKRHTARFFDEGEMELATLCVFLAGWPGTIVLLPLVAAAMAIWSVVKLIVWRERYTTLGIPFMLATLISLLLASTVLRTLGIEIY